MEERYRTIVFHKRYFWDFFQAQRPDVREKINQTLKMVENLEVVPQSHLKHVENTKGLYEIRVQFASDIFRIFCFFDKGKLIVLGNGFQKKTQKTPPREIKKALKIKAEYEKEKR